MATVKDVARAAGVSAITVSRVVNTPESVSPRTRARVEQAMAELHYVPNAAAKNLVTNRSGVVDVYVPESIDLSNPFVMHLIAGISKVLSEHMYSFLILRSRRREHRCDGYIVTGLLKDEINEFARYASERGRPVVLFGHTELPGVDCIDVDNVAGAKMGVEYLITLGHRNIAMINVDEDKDYTTDRLRPQQRGWGGGGRPAHPGAGGLYGGLLRHGHHCHRRRLRAGPGGPDRPGGLLPGGLRRPGAPAPRDSAADQRAAACL